MLEGPDHDLALLWSFVFASLCYEGLHLTAWGAPFPNATQQVLWKVSSLTLVIFGPLVSVVCGIEWWMGDYSASEEGVVRRQMNNMLKWRGQWKLSGFSTKSCLYTVLSLLLVFYVLCRIFLVVECFITMAYLPESVYQLPTWSQYFLHIGG